MQLSQQELAAIHPVPDSHGINLFAADSGRDLLACYLSADLHAHLLPHLERLGAGCFSTFEMSTPARLRTAKVGGFLSAVPAKSSSSACLLSARGFTRASAAAP